MLVEAAVGANPMAKRNVDVEVQGGRKRCLRLLFDESEDSNHDKVDREDELDHLEGNEEKNYSGN